MKQEEASSLSIRSEELFRLVAENVEDFAIFAIDLEGNAASWNPGVEKLLGYSEPEWVGRNACDIFTPEDNEQDACGREMHIARESGRAEDERWHVRKDGTRFLANGLMMALRDDAGNLRGFTKIMRDETERKMTDERLRESEALFQRVVELSPDAIAVHAEGVVLFINTAGAKILGAESPDEIVGRSITGLIHPDYHGAIRERIEKIMRGEMQPPAEIRFIRLDGTEIYGELASAPLLYQGKPAVQAVVRDLTRRRQAEEERERLLRESQEANRLKDDFLATLSHELRTPLTAILGWSRMLQANDLDKEIAMRALETIERSARTQAQLIDDLLDVSRIITGKLRLEVRAVDLPMVVSAATETLRPAAEAKDIRLQILLDSQAGPISGDPDRLQQVVWNLVSNAVKFTPHGGHVQVRLERADSRVEITVADTGKGIAPEFLPHVFDRFRQADQTTTRTQGGLGLGLSIVRQLVELHGGTVRVESRGEGEGATFTVSLPLMPLRAERRNDDEQRAHLKARTGGALDCPPELNGLHVLVVDDEPDTRDLLAAVLYKCGARVSQAGSAAEALELLGREQFDVLVSDIGMPEEDGYSFIRKVRALAPERGGRTPAAALTAYAREEDRIRALMAGFQMHVPKPVGPAELAAVVANLAGRTGEV